MKTFKEFMSEATGSGSAGSNKGYYNPIKDPLRGATKVITSDDKEGVNKLKKANAARKKEKMVSSTWDSATKTYK